MHPGGRSYAVPSGLVYDALSFSPRATTWKNASTGRVHAFHGEMGMAMIDWLWEVGRKIALTQLATRPLTDSLTHSFTHRHTTSPPSPHTGAYWGNWMFHIASHNTTTHTLHFGAGGWQEARGYGGGGAFFVEGIEEELDYVGEYYIDQQSRELFLYYNETSGTPPPPNTVAVATLTTLITISGNSSFPVRNVSLTGLTLTGTTPTFLSRPFTAPSGGDWSFANSAAVVVEGASGLGVEACVLKELAGNALLVRGWARSTRVLDSIFDRVGDSGVVTCGKTDLANLSALEVPVDTRIEGNIFSNLGVEVKQAGGVYSALSANHTIARNIFYNMPRAGININDGAHGGHDLRGNVLVT